MLEIIHDIAPGASLAHHSGILSPASFAEGTRELADAGAKIIVDDMGSYDEPFFQDGSIAQAVNDVNERGVLYVSAAGNEANRSYEALFSDAEPASTTDLHDFDPSAAIDTRQQIALPSGQAATLVLQWLYRPAELTRLRSGKMTHYLERKNGQWLSSFFQVGVFK